jgi:hypothetical protein
VRHPPEGGWAPSPSQPSAEGHLTCAVGIAAAQGVTPLLTFLLPQCHVRASLPPQTLCLLCVCPVRATGRKHTQSGCQCRDAGHATHVLLCNCLQINTDFTLTQQSAIGASLPLVQFKPGEIVLAAARWGKAKCLTKFKILVRAQCLIGKPIP